MEWILLKKQRGIFSIYRRHLAPATQGNQVMEILQHAWTFN
jgi:hypothetical protein